MLRAVLDSTRIFRAFCLYRIVDLADPLQSLAISRCNQRYHHDVGIQGRKSRSGGLEIEFTGRVINLGFIGLRPPKAGFSL